MRFDKTVLLATLIALSATFSVQARAQEKFGIDPGQTPRFETSLGYTYLHANAPPGKCGCFSANGGYGSVVFNVPRGFGVVADLSGVRAGNISGTTQSVTLFNGLFGVRYSVRHLSKRYVPFAQALGGFSHESSNYTYVQSVTGAAFSLGGGVETTIKPHWGWTIVEADWIHSYLPNAQNNIQNDLRVSTAITFRLGPR